MRHPDGRGTAVPVHPGLDVAKGTLRGILAIAPACRPDALRCWAVGSTIDGVDLGGPAMARIARDYGYTLAELRKL